ncbi:MAG: M48 family metalloprotease [Fimbriiglobus sp.]
MPIVLMLLTLAACLSVGRVVRPEWLSPTQSLLLTVITMSISAVLTLAKCLNIIEQLHERQRPVSEIAKSYNRFRRRMPMVTLSLAVVSVVFWGWSETATTWAKVSWREQFKLFPAAEVLAAAHYFVVLFLNWVSYYFAEKALFTQTSPEKEFWSIGGYLGFQTRQLLLLLGLPLTVCLMGQACARFFPQTMAMPEVQIISILGALTLFIAFPRLLPYLLNLEPLPPGEVRRDLEATAARVGVRFQDIFVWKTRGLIINALVVGVVRPARYVIFTDRLLDSMPEQDLRAVFGHEAGHVKHGHLPFYLAFFLVSATFLSLAAQALLNLAGKQFPDLLRSVAKEAELLPLGLMAVWMFVVFGWLSRVCEAQADVAGARAGSCNNPDCHIHEPDTVLSDSSRICRVGVHAMISALDRVGDRGSTEQQSSIVQRLFSWFQAWQHGPISYRIDRLLSLANQPELANSIDRYAFRVRVGIISALLVGIGLLTAWLGWDEFLRALA